MLYARCKGGVYMAIKIAVGFQKGGVSKSTTTVTLATILGASGYNVLVVDLDTQGNTTKMLTLESIYENSGKTVMEGIREGNMAKYIRRGMVDLLPAEDELSLFSRYVYKSGTDEPAHVLRKEIEKLERETEYDIILFDLPPSLSDIVANAIVASDYVLIPVHLDGVAEETLERFIHFIDGKAEILGILFTIKDNRASMEREIGKRIRKQYGGLVFSSEIRKLAAVGEFTATGVQLDRRRSRDALKDYMAVAKEVIERVTK
jgi:chromosome partitioning protein